MKKIFSIALICAVILTAGGCGQDKKPTSDEIEGGKVTLADDMESNNDKETVEEPEQSEEELGTLEQFEKDVKAGLLYENDQGQVTDKDGNVLPEYEWVLRNDYSTLATMDGEDYTLLDHFWIEDTGLITYNEEVEIDKPEPLESTGNPYLDNLRNNVANLDRENAEIVVEENPFGTGDTQTRIASDLNEYHSDIIFGNWWVDKQINGTPIAEQLPMTIARAMANANYSSNSYSEFNATTVLDKFRFVDQDTCTVDSIKRMDSSDTTCYGFYLESCQKNTDDYGNRYFTGYIDTDYVVVYGDFDKILNDDNVFMYADFIGLSDDDVPIFVGAYAEIITE